MTNEEVARHYAGCDYCKSKDKCTDPEERCCDYNLTEEVCLKKDQQFKKYLEKKKEELEHKVIYGSGGYYTKQIDIINEIINELFKEY